MLYSQFLGYVLRLGLNNQQIVDFANVKRQVSSDKDYKLSFTLSKMAQIPAQIWVAQEMQPHYFSGFCWLNSYRMTLGHEAIFSLKEWKYTSLDTKEYYLLRFSYETGNVKTRTRKEKKFSSIPRPASARVYGRSYQSTVLPFLWCQQSSRELGLNILGYKLKSQKRKAVPAGAQHRASHSSLSSGC